MSRNPLLASDTTPASADDQNGNSSAIAKAYARWRLPLMRGLARFKGSIGSAEDALHDGVVKWVAANPALDSSDEQGAYLRRTVLNGVADEFRERKAGRRLQTVSLDEAEEGALPRISNGWRAWARPCRNSPNASAKPLC
jgi:RNA polymerase sigma-70 factor (ECF subfamily)